MATIEKRTSTKGVDSYRFKVSLGYDGNGKQIIIRSGTIKLDEGLTPKQVEKELRRQSVLFEEQIKQEYAERDRDDSKAKRQFRQHVTFKELAEEWLHLMEATHEQKVSSIERLKMCRDRTYAAIGETDIKKITHRQIQNFILSLASDGTNQRNGKGLSCKTQKHYLCFISDVLKYAVECDLILKNPCKNIKVVKQEVEEKDIYSLDELKRILRTINEDAPTDYETYFTLSAYLGLRRGEVLGLEFHDFDYNNGTVSIVRTSNYRNGNTGIYTSTPKTKTSVRVLAVPKVILDLVSRLKAEHTALRAELGDQWHDTDRLFITWNGLPMHPNTPYTWLERFCEAHNLPFKGLHSFRHTFATQAITSGTDIATVSSVLGHSQTSTTLNLYTHAVQSANAKAINVMVELLGTNSGENGE